MQSDVNIGQYKLLRKIGEGGMGAVYLSEHALVGRRAAIKVLLPELSARRDIVERFFNEARAMTQVNDPGIVQMYDFGFHTDGSAYIVMELLEGETLDQRLERVGLVMPCEALRITRQVAGSLASAHARGIIHRDLKPENIFMVRDPEAMGGERAKVLDFGIAKLGGENRTKTMTGAMMGTPIYMSPEQCRGAGAIDHRSDIYSLGCVLYYLLCGRPPFDREGMGELLSAHLHDEPLAPSSIVQGLPAGIDQLVLACLAKQPGDRFGSMRDLQSACDYLLAQISAHGPSAPTVALAVPLPPGFRSASPGAGTALLPRGTPAPPHPTTLSAMTGQSDALVARRTGLWVGLGAGLVVAAIAIAVVVAGKQGAAIEQPVATPKPPPAAVQPPPAAPERPDPPAQVIASPPVIDAGVAVAAPPDATVVKPTSRTSTAKHSPSTARTTNPGDLYDDR